MVHGRRMASGLALLLGFVVVGATVYARPRSEAVGRDRLIDQRAEWLFAQRAYPLGYIPQGARARALETIEALRVLRGFRALGFAVPAPGDRWLPIGPAPIDRGQIGATLHVRPVTGRIGAIAVDPKAPAHWLVGAAQGGVWETKDAGQTWVPRTDDAPSLAMGAIAFAPNEESTVYAGTGEAVTSGDAYAGGGMLKSGDGGTTWTVVRETEFAAASVSGIVVSPADPNVVLATTTRGLGGKGSDLPKTTPPHGIYRSTNGGATWSLRQAGEATDIRVNPDNFEQQYAGIGDVCAKGTVPGVPCDETGNGVYRSFNGGVDWKRIDPATLGCPAATCAPWTTFAGGVGRVEIAIAPSDPNIVYVSIQDLFSDHPQVFGRPDGQNDVDNGLLGLWRTTDAWAAAPTWTRIPTGETDTDKDGVSRGGVFGYCGWDRAFELKGLQCDYDHVLLVDKDDPLVLYAGGIPLWKFDGNVAPPAAQWDEVSHETPARVTGVGIHVDQHALAWAGNTLVAGNDGGVWASDDKGATWADRNGMLATLQFYDGSIHPSNTNLALGGMQDNGTAVWMGQKVWMHLDGGDGGPTAIADRNPARWWVVSLAGGVIERTKSGFLHPAAPDTDLVDVSAAIRRADGDALPFLVPIEKCPASDEVFLTGTTRLWKTTAFWNVSVPNWAPNSTKPKGGPFVTALAFAASDPTCRTYAFATSDREVHVTMTGGGVGSDIDVDVSGTLPRRYVTDLAFKPTNADVLYVTLSGFDTAGSTGHVFKTLNAHAAAPVWHDVTPMGIDLPFNTIAVDTLNPEVVFAGSDIGVWKSVNGGAAWTHLGPETGMPNVAVFDLKIDPMSGRVVAFTHGRSAFVLPRAKCVFDTNQDGAPDLVLPDDDGDGFCDWPIGKTDLPGTLVISPATPIEFRGTTIVEADSIVIEDEAVVVGDPATLRSLTLTAKKGGLTSHGTLDIGASDDLYVNASAGDIDLDGTTRLSAGDQLQIAAKLGSVRLAPAVDPTQAFALFARNRLGIRARGANGSIRLVQALAASRRIDLDTSTNLAVTGVKVLSVTDGSSLVTDPALTGIPGGLDVTFTSTGQTVLARQTTVDSARNVRFATKRAGDDVCLSNDIALVARTPLGALGLIDLTGVKGTVFDDGTTGFLGRVVGGPPVAGTCP